MKRVQRFRRKFLDGHATAADWRISVALLSLAFLILMVAMLAARIHNFDLSSLLLGITFTALVAVAFFLIRALSAAHEQESRTVGVLGTTECSLQDSEERFRQMADNIQEIFWMIDAENRKTLYVNQAFETITGHSLVELRENPLSYEQIIHPEDRNQVLLRLKQATRDGDFDEQFRIVMPNGGVRWIWARGFPVKDHQGRIRRLVGTVLDITTQKLAEEAVSENLALAKAAWAEADAMREATLALTQDLKMDNVLDTLLYSLADLIPFETAQIFFMESDSRLFLARAAPHPANSVRTPMTIEAVYYPLINRILTNDSEVAVSDTKLEADWRPLGGVSEVRSWLCVRLTASRRTLGLLCLGHSKPDLFTAEHQRLALTLAIPAAAAIQNARLYECAKIYGAELERRTSDLQDAQNALMRFQSGRAS